jgi:hypothetical protein
MYEFSILKQSSESLNLLPQALFLRASTCGSISHSGFRCQHESKLEDGSPPQCTVSEDCCCYSIVQKMNASGHKTMKQTLLLLALLACLLDPSSSFSVTPTVSRCSGSLYLSDEPSESSEAPPAPPVKCPDCDLCDGSGRQVANLPCALYLAH